MAFRDDKEAAFARADALQRERDRLAAELDGANDERADLKQELEKKERELAKLRKRAAAADPERRQKKAQVVAAGVAVLALVGLGAFVSMRESSSPPPVPPNTKYVERAAIDPPAPTAIDHLRWCLVGADIDVRLATYEAPARPDYKAKERIRECDLQLGRLATNGTMPAHLGDAVSAYRAALSAWNTQPTHAPATTRAFIDASDRLRTLAAADLVHRRAERLAAARARSATPGGPVFQEMIALADEFLDAALGTEPSRKRVEDSLSAMMSLAQREPTLGFDVLDEFLAAALAWVYELRATDDTDDALIAQWGVPALRNVMTLYYRAGLDR